MLIRTLLRDPLTHFLFAGGLVFALATSAAPPPSPETITVDRAALLAFIQYRSKAFEPAAAAALLDGLDPQARDLLVADFIREEALIREAETLGLADNDYVIRQRMVQKMTFLAEGAPVDDAVDDATLAAHFAANADDYLIPPGATFSHVFLSAKDRTPDDLLREAAALRETLLRDGAGFDDATRYGERFLFHTNYVERTRDYIASQLGPDATAAIFDPATPHDAWIGPLRSPHGAHLVFILETRTERAPTLAEIADQLREDVRIERSRRAAEAAIARIVARYDVRIDLDAQ